MIKQQPTKMLNSAYFRLLAIILTVFILYQPYILLHKDQLVVKTLQRYESDKHTDYGIKTIYARKVDGQYKIVREEWAPATDRLASTSTPTTTPTSTQ